jgi:hypothetical protein
MNTRTSCDGDRADHIRSFVLRQGRVSDAQRRFHEQGMPRWGIPYQADPARPRQAVFGRRTHRILEIGCGMGETTATIAAQHPQNDYLGIEVHTPGVGSLLKEIATRELTNLRVIQHDAVEVLRDMIAPGAFRHPHFLPRPLAEKAPAEAAPDPARIRRACWPRGWRPAATCIARRTGRTMPTRCWKCFPPKHCW